MLQDPQPGMGPAGDRAGPQGFAARLALSLPHSGTSSRGPGLLMLLLISDKAPLFPALRVCLCISCGPEPRSPLPQQRLSATYAWDTPTPHVQGDPNHHHKGTETPATANPGPKALSHPHSLPGVSPQRTPCAPTAAQTDGPTDRQSPSLSLLSPTEPPRIPPGPFPSGALLMSRRIPSPLRLINLITPLQITADARPGGGARWGHP